MEAEDLLGRRIRKVSERFLEDESLYGFLTDEENAPLVDWALGEVERCLRATAGMRDDEAAMRAAEPCLSEARRKMRSIGRLVGARVDATASEFAEEVARLTGKRDLAERLARVKDDLEGKEMVEAILAGLRRKGCD